MSDAREVALLRLVAQGIVGSHSGQPAEAVQRTVALQAQQLWSGICSLVVRSDQRPTRSVELAFEEGRVLRTWSPRRTLHLVAGGDVRSLLDLLAPRALAAAAGREVRLGITSTTLGQAERLALELISERGPVGRAELVEAWRRGGLATSGQRSYHLLWHLAQAGALALGPLRDGQQLVVALDTWIAPTPVRDREEMLGELACRYFEGHGPATALDLRRWANLTASETSVAVSLARHALEVMEVDRTELLLGRNARDQLASCRREARGVVVLPGFDELIFGYPDRSATLPAERADAVLTRNGLGRNTVVCDGQVVAIWKPREALAGVGIEMTELAPLSSRILKIAVRRAAELVSSTQLP
ncbi:MAG: uncharacterized protein JWO62_2667 [Acidimicrobiaceae bacterium]|nr:uncharacterized protein [Acidimicrobiaceae bacterium]